MTTAKKTTTGRSRTTKDVPVLQRGQNHRSLRLGELRRKQIKNFILSYQRRNHGMSPTMAEIADGVGLSSKRRVSEHLYKMLELGEVTWYDGVHRSLRVLKP